MTLSVARPVYFALLNSRCRNWEKVFSVRERQQQEKEERKRRRFQRIVNWTSKYISAAQEPCHDEWEGPLPQKVKGGGSS
jgi:hypothetical protein